MTKRRNRAIAWLSLVATLFSAVSPAFAGVLLAHQPRALAQMLGIPAAAAPQSHAEHHHHDPAPKPAQAPHSDHGIYCSFCLNASSTVAVIVDAAPAVFAAFPTAPAAAESQPVFFAAFHPFFRSRAPPL